MLKSTLLVTLAILAGLATVAQEAPPTDAAEPAAFASVNGEPILLEDLAEKLNVMHGAMVPGERGAFEIDRLVSRLINDTLLGQEARAMDLDEDPEVVGPLRSLERQLVLEALEQRAIAEKAVPTEEELQIAFKHFYSKVTLRVVTSHEPEGAQAMYDDLKQGADFATVAAERSVDPYSMRGGLIDDVDRRDLPVAMGDLVFSLEPGALGGPVRTERGYSVVQLVEKADPDPERFEGLRRMLTGIVRQKKTEDLRKQLAADLQAHFSVEIDREAVASVKAKRFPDARLIPEYDTPETPVARIGDSETVTKDEYGKALLARWSGTRTLEAAEATAPIVLSRLIEKKLLLLEGYRREYQSLPEIRRVLRTRETGLLVERYLAEVLAPEVEVTPEEIRAYYDKNQDAYRKPPQVRVSQVTVKSLEEGQRIAGLLEEGADIAWLARQHSTDGFKESGGDRGWMQPRPGGNDLQSQLMDVAVGDVLGPLGALDHFVVLKVIARRESGAYSFEEVSGNVREALFEQEFVRQLDQFMTKLKSRSEIEINDEILASLTLSGSVEKTKDDHAQ